MWLSSIPDRRVFFGLAKADKAAGNDAHKESAERADQEYQHHAGNRSICVRIAGTPVGFSK